MPFDATDEILLAQYAAYKSIPLAVDAIVRTYADEYPSGTDCVVMGATNNVYSITTTTIISAPLVKTLVSDALMRLAPQAPDSDPPIRRNRRPRHAPPRPPQHTSYHQPQLRRLRRFVDDTAVCDDGSHDEEEGDSDADSNGNLAGFVVPDHTSPSASSSGPSHVGTPCSPQVKVVGQRTREERDAEGRATAIDLITPTRK